MSNTKGRVLISQNTMEILELANQVYQKHLSDGENSLLKSLMNNKWDEIGPTIAQALARHREAEALRGQSETLLRERDILMKPIEQILVNSKNLLKALICLEQK